MADQRSEPLIHQGVVQELGKSKSGNKKVRIDGEWYQSGERINLDGVDVGMTLTLEYHTYPWGGKTYRSIDAWSLDTKTPVVKPEPKKDAPIAPKTPEVNSHTIPFADEDAKMRFVSGMTQSAIQAGIVKTPKEAEYWFKCACQIVHGKDVDDIIPFSILAILGCGVAYAAQTMFQMLGA